jgi:hypothetical protein
VSKRLESLIYRRFWPRTTGQMKSLAMKMLIDMLDPDEPIANHENWNGDIDLTWDVLEFLGYVSQAVGEDDDDLELRPTPECDRLIRQSVLNWKAKLKGRYLTQLKAYLKKRCVPESVWEQSGALKTIPALDHASDVSTGVDVAKVIFRAMNVFFDDIDVANRIGVWKEHCPRTMRCHFDAMEFVNEVFGLLELNLQVRDEDGQPAWEPTPELSKKVQTACERHIRAQKAKCLESLKLSYERGLIDKGRRDEQISKYDQVWNVLLEDLEASLNPR